MDSLEAVAGADVMGVGRGAAEVAYVEGGADTLQAVGGD